METLIYPFWSNFKAVWTSSLCCSEATPKEKFKKICIELQLLICLLSGLDPGWTNLTQFNYSKTLQPDVHKWMSLIQGPEVKRIQGLHLTFSRSVYIDRDIDICALLNKALPKKCQFLIQGLDPIYLVEPLDESNENNRGIHPWPFLKISKKPWWSR